MKTVLIKDIGKYDGEKVTLKGWLYNSRSSGKIRFLIIRDGTGFIQGVLVQSQADPEAWELAADLPQESAIEVTGSVREDVRAPLGYELQVEGIRVIGRAKRI